MVAIKCHRATPLTKTVSGSVDSEYTDSQCHLSIKCLLFFYQDYYHFYHIIKSVLMFITKFNDVVEVIMV